MIYQGYFRYSRHDQESGEFGSFSILAEAEDVEQATAAFRRRISDFQIDSELFAGPLTIYLEGVVELGSDLSSGVLMNHTRFPGDVDISETNLLPGGEKQDALLLPAGGNRAIPQVPFITLPEAEAGEVAEPTPPGAIAESRAEHLALETGNEQLAHLVHQGNYAGLWCIRWPDGTISIAVAASETHAIDLFDGIGPVCREMIKPWKLPEMLLDFQFDVSSGQWLCQSFDDTTWRDLMMELAPQIDYTLAQLHRMDASEFDNDEISHSGQAVLQQALQEHIDTAGKEYEMLAAVHRARCQDDMCMFCIDDSLAKGGKGKAGLA
ncbi:MAG: hypothetical protein KDH84_23660, partial [Calditrichaeota bacterium]|nr:hypothetical protein [Calditrichota bacterium]